MNTQAVPHSLQHQDIWKDIIPSTFFTLKTRSLMLPFPDSIWHVQHSGCL
uniref:Macaca fascicularis brain cDNA clone: QflA-19166, similar to human F-box only protein 3 (FBXO3), transcript variant 2, mRNA, RefSeq: NM_033406.1 n=1 Tax=Macaca fascicularis TaxID=9541 RepID=I7GLQ8_MACFA|nr:unnamed protein product [Macaca fascicularis]